MLKLGDCRQCFAWLGVLAFLISANAWAEDMPTEPEIREPFFEFIISIVENDSLGVWSADDLRGILEATGRESRLPILEIVSIERRRLEAGEIEFNRGLTAKRELIIELAQDIAVSLPYSILGYHPGTMHISRHLVAREWGLRSPTIRMPDADGQPGQSFKVSRVYAMRLDQGYIVLDVDAWIDRLLGKILDDTWCEAFVFGHVDKAEDPEELGLTGVAMGRSRKGHAVSGAFDFRRDKALARGSPSSRALSAYARNWVAPWKQPEDSRAWEWTP